MKLKSFLALLCVASLSFASCQTKTKPVVDADALLADIKELSSDAYEGRGFTTQGNHKAQQYIAKRFKEIGLALYLTSGYIQEFEAPSQFGPLKTESDRKDGKLTGGNVVAKIEGQTNKSIIITGHHDHLGIRDGKIYNGADDDASGAAALIAIAAYFKSKNPKHTLIFASVDAEEAGMHGSEYFVVNHPDAEKNIVLNINMDMIAQ